LFPKNRLTIAQRQLTILLGGVPLKNIQTVDTAVLPVKKRRNSQPFKSSNVKGISIKTKKNTEKPLIAKQKKRNFL